MGVFAPIDEYEQLRTSEPIARLEESLILAPGSRHELLAPVAGAGAVGRQLDLELEFALPVSNRSIGRGIGGNSRFGVSVLADGETRTDIYVSLDPSYAYGYALVGIDTTLSGDVPGKKQLQPDASAPVPLLPGERTLSLRIIVD